MTKRFLLFSKTIIFPISVNPSASGFRNAMLKISSSYALHANFVSVILNFSAIKLQSIFAITLFGNVQQITICRGNSD
jgi:hypothetical protein